MSEWMMFYYEHPEPSRFVAEVRALAAADAFAKPDRRIVLATFLGHVMAANRAQIEDWMTSLADLEGDARDGLWRAAWMSNTREARLHLARLGADRTLTTPAMDVLERPLEEPTDVDVLWAYHFATGDVRALRRVVTAFEQACGSAVFERASWSLLSLIEQHRPLQLVCEDLLARGDLSPRERCGLAMTLERVDPNRWCIAMDPEGTTASLLKRSLES